MTRASKILNEVSRVSDLEGSLVSIKTLADLIKELDSRFPSMIKIKQNAKSISIDGNTILFPKKDSDTIKKMAIDDQIKELLRLNKKLDKEWKRIEARYSIILNSVKGLRTSGTQNINWGTAGPRNLLAYKTAIDTVAKTLGSVPELRKSMEEYEVLRILFDNTLLNGLHR